MKVHGGTLGAWGGGGGGGGGGLMSCRYYYCDCAIEEFPWQCTAQPIVSSRTFPSTDSTSNVSSCTFYIKLYYFAVQINTSELRNITSTMVSVA